MALEQKSVHFVIVDADKEGELFEKAHVTSFPTFHLIKRGRKLDEVIGADTKKLSMLINKFK